MIDQLIDWCFFLLKSYDFEILYSARQWARFCSFWGEYKINSTYAQSFEPGSKLKLSVKIKWFIFFKM